MGSRPTTVEYGAISSANLRSYRPGIGIFRQYDKIAAVRGLGEWRGSLRRHDPLSKTRDYSTKSN